DGRWLTTGLDGGRLLAVGTWEPGPPLLVHAFAPGGKLGAAWTVAGLVRLVDLGSGRELAILEDPNLDSTVSPVFTPDGTRLIGYGVGKVKSIHVWDLRRIGRRLQEMGLDGDWPQFPAAGPGKHAAEPMKLEVVGTDLANARLPKEQSAGQAIQEYRRA